MTWIGIALALALQNNPPSNPLVENQTNPTSVLDNTPDFRATKTTPTSHTAVRWRIQVSSSSAVDPLAGWVFSGPVLWDQTQDFGSPVSGQSPQIPYGNVGPLNVQNAALLQWNTQYWWHMKFWTDPPGPGTSFISQDFFNPPQSFRMGTPSADASAGGNGSPSGSSFRLIGVPIDIGSSVPASELLDDVPQLWRWDEPTRTYVLLAPTDPLLGGVGYYTDCAPGTTLDVSQGNVASGLQQLSFSRTTLGAPAGQEIVEGKAAEAFRGNHFFANPFNAPIDWRGLLSGGDLFRVGIDATYYRWDGTQYVTYNAGTGSGSAGPTILPFQAVGIVVSGNSNVLFVQEPTPLSGAPRLPRGRSIRSVPSDSNHWALGIEASSGGAIDTENFAGVALDSVDTHDVKDAQEPGTANTTFVLVKFPHWAWPDNAQDYTHDTRSSRYDVDDEIVWDLVVSGNTGAPATLAWPGIASLPLSDWELSLEDPATSASYDLSTTSQFVTPALSGADVPLRIRARRLTEFRGSLALGATSTAPAAATENTDASMLDVALTASGEPVVVTSFTATHTGTGDPSTVLVSLVRDGAVLAGPSPFVGNASTWTLNETVDPAEPQTWSVVYAFGAGSAGEHGAQVEASDASGTGFYTTKAIGAPAAALTSGLTSVTAPAAGSSGGGCGLLGFEVGLLLLAAGALRRALR